MRLNDYGFPDYIELADKFNLYSPENEDLKFQIDLMYREYNKVCKATMGMSPEKIEYLKKLDNLLIEKYYSKLRIDEKWFCPIDGQYKEILDLFSNEPDKQEAVQKLFEIYMKDCASNFKLNIRNLLEVK